MGAAVQLPVRPLEDILKEAVHTEASMEVHFVAEERVACEGSGGALGHPKTFYTISDKGYVECGYCDRLFVYDPSRAGEVLEGGFIEPTPAGDALPGA